MKAQRKLLLPLSFGPCSSSLLQILDQHIDGQYARMNRAGYELHVVHIDVFLDTSDRKDASNLLEKYKHRFSRHTYSTVGLEEALQLDGINWEALGVEVPPDTKKPATEKLQQLLGSVSSATSRADIASTLLTRLLVNVATTNNCESILFGDSTTRLAEKTLAQTAKGRGFSLPWQVSDGASPYGIGFNYPLRDLLKKELVTYTSFTQLHLAELVIFQEKSTNISASSKMTTIDDLMAQYFESVEDNYPSIVANVVRTSSKLQSLTENESSNCGLCGLPVAEATDGIYGWGGDQHPKSPPAKEDGQPRILCYGCSRSINS